MKSRTSSKPKNGTAVKTGSGEVDFHYSAAAASASPAKNLLSSQDLIASAKATLCSVQYDRTDNNLSVGTILSSQAIWVRSPRVTKK